MDTQTIIILALICTVGPFVGFALVLLTVPVTMWLTDKITDL